MVGFAIFLKPEEDMVSAKMQNVESPLAKHCSKNLVLFSKRIIRMPFNHGMDVIFMFGWVVVLVKGHPQP